MQKIDEIRKHWDEFVDACHGLGPSGNTDALLRRSCEPLKIEGDVLILGFYADFHMSKMEMPKYREPVEGILQKTFDGLRHLRCVSLKEDSWLRNIAKAGSCDICGAKLDLQQGAKAKHMREKHPKYAMPFSRGKYRCVVCGCGFPSYRQIITHCDNRDHYQNGVGDNGQGEDDQLSRLPTPLSPDNQRLVDLIRNIFIELAHSGQKWILGRDLDQLLRDRGLDIDCRLRGQLVRRLGVEYYKSNKGVYYRFGEYAAYSRCDENKIASVSEPATSTEIDDAMALTRELTAQGVDVRVALFEGWLESFDDLRIKNTNLKDVVAENMRKYQQALEALKEKQDELTELRKQLTMQQQEIDAYNARVRADVLAKAEKALVVHSED
jgi:hypothetical protein